MKFLLPIINFAIAVSLFIVFTDGMMVNAPLSEKVVNAKTGQIDVTQSVGGIRALQVRQKQLDEALLAADKVSVRVNQLSGTYNNFAESDKARLDEFLPDHVDNIQLIIDVNGIAKKNGMSIKNVKVSTGAQGEDPSNSKTISTLDPRLGAMVLSFSVTGTYEAYKKLVADLASSLRIIDISSVSFATDDKGVYTYNLSLKTYWLK